MYFELSSSVTAKWFLFVTEETEISFEKLELVLRRFDPDKVSTCAVVQNAM